MGAAFCHGNQPKRHITIILAILIALTQATFFLNKSYAASVVLEELSFQTFLFFLIKCCHGNQTKWSLVIKHIN